MSNSRSALGLAVHPGMANSLHLTELAIPEVGANDVLIHVIRAGICGTDREIIHGAFGRAPAGSGALVIGHEVLGRVERVGSAVSTLREGDIVTSTVRRPCGCPHCSAGHSDFCTTRRFQERGIFGLHGFMTECFVENEAFVVPVPEALESTGVLVEPLSVSEKAWRVATAVQSRIDDWQAMTAAVFGAGPIGLLATLALRARGIDTYCLDIKLLPNASAEIAEASGATYVCTAGRETADIRSELPPIDLVIECSGSGAAVIQAMQLLGANGVMVALSNTAGNRDYIVPVDRLNIEWVGGNKALVGSVNSTRVDFGEAIASLERIESRWPGLAARMITHRLDGLSAGPGLVESTKGAIKAVIEIGA